MAWKMCLYVERRSGTDGWQAVVPPLPSSPRGRAKWGTYTPKDPIESLALLAADEKDRVPTEAPCWDFGFHPTGMQQLGAFFSYLWEETDHEDIMAIEPFLDPCGVPSDMSPQVQRAAAKGQPVTAIWYTLGEISSAVWTRKKGYDVPADRRVVALQMELERLARVFFPEVCSCRRTGCGHRDDMVRAVVWFEPTKKKGD